MARTGMNSRAATRPVTPSSSTRVLRSQTAATASKVSKPQSKPRRRRLDPWAPKTKPKPTSKPRPRATPPTHFTCRICIEEQTIDQFPRWFNPKRARGNQPHDVPTWCVYHLARNPRSKKFDPVCKSCIGNAMSARIDTLGARQLSAGCLEPGCNNPWPWTYIVKYLPAGGPLEKYNMEMLEVWKQEIDPKLITCVTPGCGAIGLPDVQAPGYPQVSCHTCDLRFCATCLTPWHKDITCAEKAARELNDKISDPEKDTLQFMQSKDAKRCPNCQLVIEKDGGCNSMFCSACHKYFNWEAAASAVVGTVKAATAAHGNSYWNQPREGDIVCEMDAIEQAKIPERSVRASTRAERVAGDKA